MRKFLLLLLAMLCASSVTINAQTLKGDTVIANDGRVCLKLADYVYCGDSLFCTYDDGVSGPQKYALNCDTTFNWRMPLDIHGNLAGATILDDMMLTMLKFDETGSAVKLSSKEKDKIQDVILYAPQVQNTTTQKEYLGINMESYKEKMIKTAGIIYTAASSSKYEKQINGGEYLYNLAYSDEVPAKSHRLTINTASYMYLSDLASNSVIDILPKGGNMDIRLIVRSGYPFNKEKFNGAVKWSLQSYKDGKPGETVNGQTNLTTEGNPELIDTLTTVQNYTTTGDSIAYTLTYANGETESCFVPVNSEHTHTYSNSYTITEDTHYRKANCSYTDECKNITTTPEEHYYFAESDSTSTGYFRCKICNYEQPEKKQKCLTAMRQILNDLIAEEEEYYKTYTSDEYRAEYRHLLDEADSILNFSDVPDSLIDARDKVISHGRTLRSKAFNIIEMPFLKIAETELTYEQYEQYKNDSSMLALDYANKRFNGDLSAKLEEILNNAKAIPSAIGITESACKTKSTKYLYGKTIVIEKNGIKYNVAGQRVK